MTKPRNRNCFFRIEFISDDSQARSPLIRLNEHIIAPGWDIR
jgi:hypothetical protein